MKDIDKLKELSNDNRSVITTALARDIGISKERIRMLAIEGLLERVGHGVYILPDSFYDKMYISQLMRPKTIYSHETALFLHELSDRDPTQYSVTVPTGYNTKSLIQNNFKVYSIKKELYNIGIDTAETSFGNKVTVYSVERTICDCIRSRSRIDPAIVSNAVNRYSKIKNKNLNLLMETAGQFGVKKLVRTYMEVLM